MGCRQTVAAYDRRSLENAKLEKYEETLGFKQNECSFYEGILSRLINSSHTSEQLLDLFQKFSKITLSESFKEILLASLNSSIKPDLKSFRCFCILLSKSSELAKGETL